MPLLEAAEALLRRLGIDAYADFARALVAEAEALIPLTGDDPQTSLVNENFERIGALLFGAQDYAIIATR